MNRRHFFQHTALATLGSGLVLNHPFNPLADKRASKKAKNIIMIVSDGMSMGTLTMADLLIQRLQGRGSHWLNLYRDHKVSRGLMDMASASSMITDSAAASSSWGGGVRVKNGSLNVSPNGEEALPIMQKFKAAGKKVGCVTTVPITHATPAGFLVSSKSRNDQAGIAQKYAEHQFDVLMGGGDQYFNATKRKDGKDLYQVFKNKGYQVFNHKDDMRSVNNNQPILGIFSEDALPYTVDLLAQKELQSAIPTLAEMTAVAINQLASHRNGFVLQVEAGKVDWAAHANDAAALLFDQIAADDAVKVALDFAASNQDTLVIITTDHGNANPGLLYGKNADKNFESLQNYKASNEMILNAIKPGDNLGFIKELFNEKTALELTTEEAQQIQSYYSNLEKSESGLYNYKNLPYKLVSDLQKSRTNVGWIGTDHSADFVEIAMFGAGSNTLKPFMKNTDLHHFLLKVAEVENKF